MESMLNDNLNECYFMTGEVVVKYYELYDMIIQDIGKDYSLFESYISDIFGLVIKEYGLYSNLTAIDINNCLKKLENIDCDSSLIDARFKRKLQMQKDVNEGFKIDTKELNLDFVNNSIDFTLFASLSSLIDVIVMKNLRKKLDVISTDNYNDLIFVQALYKQFNGVLFNQTFGNNLSEVINLSCNMNVYNIPNIDISILFNKINNIFGRDDINSLSVIDYTLIELAKVTVDRLVEVNFENNPKVVFNNLLFITRLEVLISYMNKDCLLNLLNYCEMVRFKNSFGIDNVINLIKNKVK